MLVNERLHTGSIVNGKVMDQTGRLVLDVSNPYNNDLIGTITCAEQEDVSAAVDAAHGAFHSEMKSMAAHRRSEILRKTADLLEKKAERFARMLSLEAGKPMKESRGEVRRAVQVLRFSSEEAKAIYGESITMDSAEDGENRLGLTKHVPLGVVAAVTPFNFPLNLVLHKLAPAIAAGNTVVLKPAEKTPFSSVFLHQLFVEAGLPPGAVNVLMGPGEKIVETLVTHEKVKKVTFTGSGAVGWRIKDLAGRKKVTLELGSNAANIVFADADLEQAVQAIAAGGYGFAGQACVSAQRIYIHESIVDIFTEKLSAILDKWRLGDPLDDRTDIGPMITEEAARRAEAWINEAVEQGATLVAGGKRHQAFLAPAILSDVSPDMKVVCLEVFAPIVSIISFHDEQEAIAMSNSTDLALQAGVFTTDINRAMRVADALETGGVWINDVSSRRYDHIPYGGVKNSGIGKEGVKYAVQDMLETKFIGIKLY